MTPDCLQVVRQPIRIHGDPSARPFATVISANVSCRLFAASDGVISSVDPWATFPIGVQSILPACFRVNPYYALQWVDPCAARSWVNLYYALQWLDLHAACSRVNLHYALQWVELYAACSRVNFYAVHSWVNLYYTLQWVNLYATCPWVNPYAARPWVNLYATCTQVIPYCALNLYATHWWVNVYAAHQWYGVCPQLNLYNVYPNMYAALLRVNLFTVPYPQENLAVVCPNLYGAHLWVNLYCTLKWENQCANCQWKIQNATMWWVNNKLILPARFEAYNLPQFEESHVSVWRDSTAQYNAADHPFFVFHPMLVDSSNFGETFKMYAHHLRQYRLFCVIELVLRWSNHWCHYISKNACMLVNFDLTPQQHCRRAYLSTYQSQFYKHDFAVISSAFDLQTNYAIVGFVKYLENIIHWILQHKYIYKISVKSSAKDKIKIKNYLESPEHNVSGKIGGGQRVEKIEMKIISPFIIYAPLNVSDIKTCEFVDHLETSKSLKKYQNSDHLLCNVPLHHLMTYLFKNNRISIGYKHGIHIPKKMTKCEITNLFKIHDDICKHEYVTVFRPCKQISNSERYLKYCKTQKSQVDSVSDTKQPESLKVDAPAQNSFPPAPPDASLRRKIINDFCNAIKPSKFEEAGCAVCGALTLKTELSNLSSLNIDLSVLNTSGLGFTRKERKYSTEPISELDGPVIDTSCGYICISCKDKLRHRKLPKFALARGLWLGEIPDELQQLSFAEKLLVGRVRHNRCVVRVAKGMHKMIANAVTFEHPMQKIYTVLPPPIEEMDEVLAFIFTGPCQPTEDDFCRIPLLVRRNKVAKALEWLKLNHRDYADLEISHKNLESYPEDSPPVVINYRHSTANKIPEATSVHDMELEHGTEEGMCPFTVHTLTSEEYDTTSSETLKAMAAKHLDDGGKVLAIGHSKEPQSIWRNPKLYPQMFPWLFPYGLGAIGHERQRHKLSDAEHKRHLLLYHDKRFQKDPYFPLIAFNHEQIKDSTTSGFILAKQKSFDDIANRLLQINSEVLADITERMMKGERVKGESQDEKDCLQLIHDLDRIGGHVKGSITSKKYMRNEIWSLISFRGAPSWYITLSPADNKHPISLYYADTKEEFTPIIRSKSEKDSLIADNPVASAQFFSFYDPGFH